MLNPIALFPTKAGCAVFFHVTDEEKTGIIYVDPQVGFAINLALIGQIMPRPMTHDLTVNILDAFQAEIKGACIIARDQREGIYQARLIIEVCNDTMTREIIEVDARPSDALALTVRMKAPFYIKKSVWDTMEDVSSLLNDLQESTTGEYPPFQWD